MKKARWVSAAAGTAVLTAGFALPGATAAYADSGGNGNGGVLSILSGNNVNAPVSAPTNVCGISLAMLGFGNSGCQGGATSNTTVGSSGSGGGGNGNAGVESIGSGNTVNAPVSTPINVCGVSVATSGFSNSHCKGGSASSTIISGGSGSGGGNGNAGVESIGSGNTVNAPVSTPTDVCGIAMAMFGFSNAACLGGSASSTIISGGSGSGGGNGNAGVESIGSGNTLNAPVSAPVNICGVSLAEFGFANSGCQGGAASTTTIGSPGSGGSGSGNGGVVSIGSGNTVNAPVSAPVNVCGIAAGIVGFANATCVGGSSSTTIITPPTTPPSMPPPCQCTTAPPSTPPTTSTPGTPTTPTTPTTPGTPGTPGSGPTGGGVTTSVSPGSLPITGADLAGLAAVALCSLGLGATALVAARRRRRNGSA